MAITVRISIQYLWKYTVFYIHAAEFLSGFCVLFLFPVWTSLLKLLEGNS